MPVKIYIDMIDEMMKRHNLSTLIRCIQSVMKAATNNIGAYNRV